MSLYRVEVQHGTYRSVVSVHADDDDEAIAKARARLRRDGFFSLPMAYEHARVLDRQEGAQE